MLLFYGYDLAVTCQDMKNGSISCVKGLQIMLI